MNASVRVLAVALALALPFAPSAAVAQLLVAAGDPFEAGGRGRLTLEPPWAFPGGFTEVGSDAIVRSFGRRAFVVSRSAGTIQILNARTGQVVDTVELGKDSQPQDIAVVSRTIAYVTRANATRLLRLNPSTGDFREATDLAPFADEDGVPDLGTMAVHRGRVFVQIRRIVNAPEPPPLPPPPLIAVVDGATGRVIDTEPKRPGVQAIELQGTTPRNKMQIVGRRLYVGAFGAFFDAGGIEAIDLRTLRSLGLVIREDSGQVAADLHTFVFTSRSGGYLAFSTDFALSSHLLRFTVDGHVEPVELFVVVDYAIPNLVYSKRHDLLYLPTSDGLVRGIHVFDAATGERLTDDPIPTPGVPTDLELIGGS
jgi:hypothetical protein